MEIDRRTALAALLAAAGLTGTDPGEAEAQAPAGPDPSLYIPRAHLVEDRAFLHDFMDEYAFVDLVTPAPTLRITHIPSVLDRTQGRYGTIYGHVSAQNPQRQAFDGTQQAVVVFRGPQGYISPEWYGTSDHVVPTWNFAVVHAAGRPKAVEGTAATHALLARLIAKFETAAGTKYDFSKLPTEYVQQMMKGIAPFAMEIEAIEGKFKLGQERKPGDRQGILAHLGTARRTERGLLELTQAFYQRQG
jgi:transcriptional regulator